MKTLPFPKFNTDDFPLSLDILYMHSVYRFAQSNLNEASFFNLLEEYGVFVIYEMSGVVAVAVSGEDFR